MPNTKSYRVGIPLCMGLQVAYGALKEGEM